MRSTEDRKRLYVIDLNTNVAERFLSKLGRFYDVQDCYAGGEDAFDRFVADYVRAE